VSHSTSLSEFATRLREFIRLGGTQPGVGNDQGFQALALDLFRLQYQQNLTYRRFCQGRVVEPGQVQDWREIPAIPTAAFKEADLSCLPPPQRKLVFFSSGTTEQRPSRHFHNDASLEIYEASLMPWFTGHVLADSVGKPRLLMLTPPPALASNSSLVHMFETIRRQFDRDGEAAFAGTVAENQSWMVDRKRAMERLCGAVADGRPLLVLGTAFSFVDLLDHLEEKNVSMLLPPGSLALETGGYKNRSRSLPKAELYSLISKRLGIPEAGIVSEYGMSELSSQAYDHAISSRHERGSPLRRFKFPPWARVQIISPENGAEVGEGETGLIRIFDLANVYSVMAVQTQDLGIRRADCFELIGRAVAAEPRGCSLLAAHSPA
jgi:hypothetical protein